MCTTICCCILYCIHYAILSKQCLYPTKVGMKVCMYHIVPKPHLYNYTWFFLVVILWIKLTILGLFLVCRSAKLEIREKEIEGVRAKCIPRRSKNQSSRKELGSSTDLSCGSSGASISSSSSSQHGSKRLVVTPQL